MGRDGFTRYLLVNIDTQQVLENLTVNKLTFFLRRIGHVG